jgi:16S rRNA (uracil1498-N3)-methyltransferase
VAFDPARALEAAGEVVALEGGEVRVRLAAPRPAALTAARPVTVLQAAAKANKIDAVVRDATELGATTVVVVTSARCQRRPEPRARERWARIAIEAARQCGRGDAPEVLGPTPLAAALGDHRPARGRAVCLQPGAPSLARALADLDPHEAVTLAIGPEGGFTPEELALAESASYRLASLGRLVLRSETACAAALGALALLSDPVETA